ncbi:transglutaminase family protein [Antarctobacter jejuensis]|uniref:transglutaminase family protein n=1 Tax=Antarctobacter jejuensis TaxID=1439938 RepID=UPI003FD294C4
MLIRIKHTTRYSFSEPVSFGLQQIRKTPKSRHQQEVVDWTTDVTGGGKQLEYTDQHLNTVELIGLDKGITELEIRCEGVVKLQNSHGVLGRHIGPAPLWLYRRHTPQTKAGQGVRALVRDLPEGTDLERAHALMAAIAESVDYVVGSSDPDWSAEQALAEGKGVCQDHTHVFLACAREMGLPARYVSGYLLLDHTTDQDAMHAWAETYLPGLGWVGFDCSNCMSPDQRYVRVATGLDYHDAAPVRGSRQGGGETESLDVQIEVAQQ